MKWCFLSKLANERKFFRRVILFWSIFMNTAFVIFLMDHEFLINIGGAGATVVTGVLAILTTVITFYQWHAKSDDDISKIVDLKKKELEEGDTK